MKSSLEGKLAILLCGYLLAASTVGALVSHLTDSAPLGIAAAVGCGLLPSLMLARYVAKPVARILRAMTSAVGSYADGDFNHALVVNRNDEVGDLLAAHNTLAKVLRKQHTQLVQRELLLDTVTQHSPVALVLVDGQDRVEYANIAAGQLLNQGRSIRGRDFEALLESAPRALREAARSGEDCLFSAELNNIEESFHVACRAIQLRGVGHTLYQFKRLTRELSRQELATWKKLIRVLSHELNNSLAPLVSLAQSGAELSSRRSMADAASIFDAIAERANHLHQFLQGYAEFAKLPAPRCGPVIWSALAAEITYGRPCRIIDPLPERPGWFDRTQVVQALTNLLKNASEAGGPPEEIELAVTSSAGEDHIAVLDRGPGMSDVVMAQALLPFYSTKRSGMGLGLALVRDIAEAHGGRIRLSNRQDGGLSATLSLPAGPPLRTRT